MMWFRKKSQSIVEFTILFIIAVTAMSFAYKYINRAINARLKQVQDELNNRT